MPGRLPTRDDFPSKLVLSITPPSSKQPPTNILILLHGLGDSHESFEKLGKQMNLPETACISIRGPKPLPFELGGFHYGDDIVFDQSSGQVDADCGFKEIATILHKLVLQDVLVEKCGYKTREVMLFGFGQGGMAALSVAAAMQDSELGGVISIGGPLPSEAPASLKPKCKTPVLVCGGSSSSLVTGSAEEKLKNVFEFVEIKRYRKPSDSMPSNRDEMLPIMQFFARRLRSVRGVPEGSVEVG